MRIGIGTGTAATVLLLVGTAQGGDDWKSTLAEAKTQARASEHLKAAGLFGDAFAAVQKAGDIVGEQEVDEAWREFLDRVPEVPRRGGQEVSSTVPGPREVTAALMERLDPARCGAFVSAPCLAGDLLLDAIRRGDGRYVAEAAAVLEPHGKGPKSGTGLKVLAMLARGTKEAASADGKAAASLVEARDAALRQDWTDLSLAAGVELAALHAKAGDATKAAPDPPPGTATVHYRSGRGGTHHWTVEVDVPGKGKMETHQVILDDARSATQVVEVGPSTFRKPPDASKTVELPNADAARQMQRDQIDRGVTGEWQQYGKNANSCATAVCEVVAAGGGKGFPKNPADAGSYLRHLFGVK